VPGPTLSMLLVVLGTLIGRARLLGLSLPFAVAFFSTVRHGRPRASNATGLAILAGCLTTGNFWLALRMLIALLVIDASARWAGHRKLCSLPRRGAGAAAGFVLAAVFLSYLPYALLSGIGAGDALLGLSEALVAAIAAVVLQKGLLGTGGGLHVDLTRGESLLGVTVVFAAALTGLGGASLAGISLVVVVGAAVTMFLARAGGGAVGALAGVAAGMVAGFSGEAGPAQIGAWAVAGMLAGIGGDVGTVGAVLGFLLGMLCLAGLVDDPGYVVAALKQAALASALLVLIPGRVVSRVRLACRGPDAADQSTQVSAALWLLATSRLSALAGVFGEIAAAFEEPAVSIQGSGAGTTDGALALAATATGRAGLGQARVQEAAASPSSVPGRPIRGDSRRPPDLQAAIEEVAQACCAGCRQRAACWGDRSAHTSRGFSSLLRRLQRGAGASGGVEPLAFIPWCRRSQDVLAVAAGALQTRLAAQSVTARTAEARQLLARQLNGVARITGDLAQQMTIGEIPSGLLRAREVEDALREAGLACKQALLTPARRGFEVHVQSEPCGASWCEENAARLAGAVLGRRLTLAGRRCELPGGGCHFILATAPRMGLAVGKARHARTKEVVSGDSYLHRPIGPDRYLLLLSDGMGSGVQAARESSTAIRLIQAMLEAGFPLEATIQAINSILVLRSPQEVFATVDLALVELGDGSVEMAKIGACPSYLVRNGEVELLAAKGLPLGIVDDIAVTRLQSRLHPGDYLIMISDGVFGGKAGVPRREDWVRRALAGHEAADPQRLAEELLAEAVGRQPGITLDDAAVLVARLHRTAGSG